MLYSFPKEQRFVKRRKILYICFDVDATIFTNWRTPFHHDLLPLDSEINMILLSSPIILLHPTLIILKISSKKIYIKDSLLERVENKCRPQVLWLNSWETKTQVLATISLLPCSIKPLTACTVVAAVAKIKIKLRLQVQVNTPINVR